MSAFDEARGSGAARGGGSRIPRGGGRGGGGFDAAPSYQLGGDAGYAQLKEGIERDLRKLTTVVAATRKQAEQLGSRQDSADLRKRM
jgi:hypothetical protein